MVCTYHGIWEKLMRKSVEAEETLQVSLPKVTKKSLKIYAAQTGDPMRLIVLRALSKVGIKVPAKELQDRRKSK